MRRAAFSIVFLGAVLLAGCSDHPRAVVRLATSTSTHNSGLLDVVVSRFEATTGIRVEVIVAGTGQSLAIGRRGDADILLVHAREREEAFVAEGHGSERREVMWNDFVIVGPPADPAGVAGLRDAREALRRISAQASLFVSRGDDSGTHIRERKLWEQTGVVPNGEPWYVEAGQGAGQSLLLADEKDAYLLIDRGTWLAFSERLAATVLVEGDPLLRNPYGMILVNPARHPGVHHAEAKRLLDFFVSATGQELIGNFRVAGQVLFHPVAGGG